MPFERLRHGGIHGAGVRACAWLVLAGLAASACASVPLPPRISAEEEARIAAAARQPKRARITGCMPEPPAGTEPCIVVTRRVTELLRDTGLFSHVGAAGADADVSVQIHPVAASSDDSVPPTSPAYLVLSAFVPLWWSETFGYRLSVQDHSGARVAVDTTREGNEFLWSLAALLNVVPDRGFMPSAEREADQIGVQLLPLWPVDPAAGVEPDPSDP